MFKANNIYIGKGLQTNKFKIPDSNRDILISDEHYLFAFFSVSSRLHYTRPIFRDSLHHCKTIFNKYVLTLEKYENIFSYHEKISLIHKDLITKDVNLYTQGKEFSNRKFFFRNEKVVEFIFLHELVVYEKNKLIKRYICSESLFNFLFEEL